MRPDMSRLIIEDGRCGNGGPKTCYDKLTRRGEELENLPSRESMSRHRKQDNNSQGDRLKPLRRFLRDNVGRPWNKVFAEICEHADLRTIRGFHLRQHVEMEVYTGGPLSRWLNRPTEEFLVDSFGILRINKERRRRRWPRTTEVVELELNGVLYKKKDELWFRVEKEVTKYTVPVWPEQIIESPKGRLGLKVKPSESTFTRWWSCNKKELKVIRETLAA